MRLYLHDQVQGCGCPKGPAETANQSLGENLAVRCLLSQLPNCPPENSSATIAEMPSLL